MDDYDPAASFGEDVARIYDRVALRGDEAATVAFLAELAGDGPALELAIGTGRIALPLAGRNVRVDGIEISTAMIDRLRAKPGGERISVTRGDFADVGVDGDYELIYVVFNTLFNLLSQDEQVRCFENVAAHLGETGAFVVETGTPAFLYRLRGDQYVDAEAIAVDAVHLDVARHDPVTQTLEESHVSLTQDGVRLNPIVTRYAWPSELDLMARIAGLRLAERWGGWRREAFTSRSENCISVYRHRVASG